MSKIDISKSGLWAGSQSVYLYLYRHCCCYCHFYCHFHFWRRHHYYLLCLILCCRILLIGWTSVGPPHKRRHLLYDSTKVRTCGLRSQKYNSTFLTVFVIAIVIVMVIVIVTVTVRFYCHLPHSDFNFVCLSVHLIVRKRMN